MIAVDTAAIIAIALDEPEAEDFGRIISTDPSVIIGVPTLLEARMVLAGRYGPIAAGTAMAMLVEGWQTVPFTADTDAFEIASARVAMPRA